MTRSQRLLMWAIIASQFAPPFMFSGVAVALPAMGRGLDAGATALGLMETLYMGGSLVFLLPIGRIADTGDKNSLYKYGLLGFGLTSILVGFMSSVPLILATRFIQGLFSAIFTATGPAILADIVPKAQRGKAYGASLGAIYGGLLLGPVVAGFLVDLWHWRAVFMVGGLVLLLGFVLILVMLPSQWRSPGKVVHVPSAGLMTLSVLSLIAGTSLIHNEWMGYAGMVAGLSFGIGFLILQKRLTHPLLDLKQLLAHKVLKNALVVQLLLYLNAYSTIFLLSLLMQVSLGHSAQTNGQILAIGSLLMAVLAPISGMLADRFRPQSLTLAGVVSILLCMFLAMRLDAESSLLFVTVVVALHGIGFALFASPNMTLIMNSVPEEASTMASALSAKARGMGMIAGMMITAVFISQTIGHDPVTDHPLAFIEIAHGVFTVLAGLAALALVFAVTSHRRSAT